jgi:type II secretory ATPase GspE/PulE/Tfp pilus assembly ATPase PilB-like protein
MTPKPDSAAIEDYLPFPDDMVQYPPEFSELRGAIKLGETSDSVEIGVTEGSSDETFEILRNFHGGKRVVFRTVDRIELAGYLGKKVSEATMPGQKKTGNDRILLDRLANDAPIINLVNSICIDGIRNRASDIHIEAMKETVRVRYRIDGVLRTTREIEKQKFQAISSRIKIMSNLNIMEHRLPQDGRISVNIGAETVDLRVSIVPTTSGESIVLRLFNKSGSPMGISDLGFGKEELKAIGRLLKIPHGLILVTGPTGCGKTTTLNAMLRQLPADKLKIVTIEDPVEYLIDGVNQIQTNDAIKLSFDTILRRVLRQDPNVIMVGEIRDSQTAELATRAALTGHLVLSTLHTNSSSAVIARLKNMGVPPYLIASILRGAIAQRLVRKTCPHCAEKRAADPIESKLLEAYKLPSKGIASGKGCEKCSGTGFLGRLAVTEIFGMDLGLEEAVLNDVGINEITKLLEKRGMKTMARDGMEKASKGLTTIEELEREISL